MISWRMQPSTASLLGVIAIVSVMITATVSEAENNGAIEQGINHLVAGEEDRHFPDGQRTAANETTDRNDAVVLANESATELLVSAPRRLTTVATVPEPKDAQLDFDARQDDRNETASSIDATDELQRDQSDVRGPLDDDPRRTIDGSALTIRSSDEDHRNTTPGSSEDFPLSYEEATSTRVAVLEYQMMSSSGIVGQELQIDEFSKVETQKNQSRSTTTEETYDVGTEVVEKKGVDEIKAISFQIPSNDHEYEDRDDEEKQQTGKGNVKGDGKKDPSRSANNLLLGGNKSTKAFYEIKPSIKTEMERNNEGQQPSEPTTTQRIVLPGRRFVLPSVDSAFGKFGPYFEDGGREMNITARIGSTVLLDCKIGMLGDKKVTWLQHSKDSFRLLTVGRIPYSVDQRISLNFRYPSNWRLQILYASPRDSGLYKCQVATHPPLVKKINVIVTAPQLTITDDAGRIVPKERHLKAGSALRLRCEARDVLESQNESVVWTRGDETLTEDVSENRTTEISASEEVLVIVSTLIVERASPRHAGNYSCVVPGKARTTIAVHVLNGELPAAVHDGNGVSRAVLNLWLIHLTISYVFSR